MQRPVLHFRQYGAPGEAIPILLLHGLFGSGVNWHGIAQQLAPRQVVVPDLRNHGRSFHDPDFSYPSQATDLVALMDLLELERAWLVGHSMGGKVAMWLALEQPQRVAGMVAVDMAPVPYPNRFERIIEAMSVLNLRELPSRSAAHEQLAEQIPERAVRDYLLQNLERDGDSWRWRVNLAGLQRGIGEMLGFPDSAPAPYTGPSHFIYGGRSPYMQAEQRAAVRSLFPRAQLQEVAAAGHWVYAEQPEGFLRALQAALADG